MWIKSKSGDTVVLVESLKLICRSGKYRTTRSWIRGTAR
jgi:hypothetical protein